VPKRTQKNPLDAIRRLMTWADTALGDGEAKKILETQGGGVSDPNNLQPRLRRAVEIGLKSALGKFERERELRKLNPWELAPNHPQFIEATEALCAAWREARTTTYEKAREYMRKEFERYNAGAPGTRGVLYEKLKKRFP
jgi:hypothetical protein